jgi:D-alanyl-D-alanine dipeptidase
MQDTGISKHLHNLVDVIALSRKNCPTPILANLAYATIDNFVGQLIDGYTPHLTDFALLIKPAALALCKVQTDLIENHAMGLLIYDTYRPQRAVKHFVRWSKQAVSDDAHGKHELEQKTKHYPHIEKSHMFELGYVAEDSQHCYGHTVDLVLVDKDGSELNHGVCFDYMDTLSHLTVTADDVGTEAFENRQILRSTMEKYGFIAYPKEYWHFSFQDKIIGEPMDFPITPELKGLNVE